MTGTRIGSPEPFLNRSARATSNSRPTSGTPSSITHAFAVVPPMSNEKACVIDDGVRSEEHTSELQSRLHLVCRLLLEKKKKQHHKYSGPDMKKCTPALESVT